MQGELFQGMERNIHHDEDLEYEKPTQGGSVFEKFQVTLSFDKLIVISISSVVLLAVIFALGVEKGKQKAVEQAAAHSLESGSKTVIQQEWTSSKQESQVTETLSESESELTSETSEASTSAEAIFETDLAGTTSTPAERELASAVRPEDMNPDLNTQEVQGNMNNSTASEVKQYTVRLASYVKRAAAEYTAQRLKRKGYDTSVKQSGRYFVLNVGRFSGKQDAELMLSQLRKEPGLTNEGIIRTV